MLPYCSASRLWEAIAKKAYVRTPAMPSATVSSPAERP